MFRNACLFFVGVLFSQVCFAELTLEMDSGLVVVPVEIQGKSYKAILDTGASLNVIDPFLEKLTTPLKSTAQLNFSDHVGGKSQMVSSEILVDGTKQTMEFAVNKTRLSGGCCDMILGKPFFNKNTVVLDFLNKKFILNGKTSFPGKMHQFSISPKEKEIVIPCKLNGTPTQARLDLGSQQALDVTGSLVQKLMLSELPGTVSLDTLLQPGMMMNAVTAMCDAWKLDSQIPAVFHPPSKTGLGQGKVGMNIGAPYLTIGVLVLDLPHSQLRLYQPDTPQHIAFNALHILLTEDLDKKILVKSVLSGGVGAQMGLRVGDQITKINDTDTTSLEPTYQKIESLSLGPVSLSVQRDGLNHLLKFNITTLMPQKIMYPQTFYSYENENKLLSNIQKISDKIQSVRMVYNSIDADFSLQSQLGDISAREFLLKPLSTKLISKNNSFYFEGLKLDQNGLLTPDLKTSQPSLGLSCKKQSLTVESFWTAPTIVEFIQTSEGCGQKIKTTGAFYLSQNPTTPASETNAFDTFLFLSQGKFPAHWGSKEITLSIDKRAPSWVDSLLKEAISDYSEVVKPQLKIKMERKDISQIPLSSPNTVGIYWSEQGHNYDQETRFAITRNIQEPATGEIIDADIILREPEFLQFEQLVTTLTRAAIIRTPGAKEKLEELKHNKIENMRKNVMYHELGHLLGLAHNFSKKEKSIMSYDTITSLSEYDKAALAFLYRKENPTRVYDTKPNPESEDSNYE